MEFSNPKHLSTDQLATKLIFRLTTKTFVKKYWSSLLGGHVLWSGLDGHCFASSQSSS